MRLVITLFLALAPALAHAQTMPRYEFELSIVNDRFFLLEKRSGCLWARIGYGTNWIFFGPQSALTEQTCRQILDNAPTVAKNG